VEGTGSDFLGVYLRAGGGGVGAGEVGEGEVGIFGWHDFSSFFC